MTVYYVVGDDDDDDDGKRTDNREKPMLDTVDEREKKSLRHPVFPGGHPSKY